MSDFISDLLDKFSSPRPRRHEAECHAKDPQNCRWHQTGRFSPSATALGEDRLSPAERELERIKARKKAENAKPQGMWRYFGVHDGSRRHPAPSSASAGILHRSPVLSGGYGDFLEGWRKHKKQKLRTVEELQKELDKTDPAALAAVVALGEYTDAEGKTHKTRVSPLTGKPVSPMCNTIINALMCGIKVADAEIEAMPEWKDAQRRYADYSASLSKKRLSVNTWSDTSKEREAIRKDVFAKMSSPVITHETNDALKPGETYAVQKGFRFDIITGLPAGGKNAAFADRLSVEHGARLADSDIVKRMLPGYADGLGANIVHDESTFINKDILDETFRKTDPKYGDNIVYPTLGNNTTRLFDFIDRAHDAGYKVHLHFNDITPEKAKGRMIYRMIQTGRYLPLRVFSGSDDARHAYNAVRDYADSAEWFESGAGKGVEPRKIESKVNVAPKVREKPKPSAFSDGYLGYISGGSHGSASGAAAHGRHEPSFLDTGAGDDDIPEWLADDSSFWDENLGLSGSDDAPVEKKSGLSIDDILANFEKRKNGGAI